MNSRKLHKIIGLILILPMLGWCITGIIFFTKPGYKEAYEQLAVKTYPLEQPLLIPPSVAWEEVRVVNTILGLHLLVKSDGKFEQLDPVSLLPRPALQEPQYKILLEDAFLNNTGRYGDIVNIEGTTAKTSTGIDINLDWNTLKLVQKGNDTKLINILYKIHYLQWSPFKSVNLFLGVMGLILLISLTFLGIKLTISKQNKHKK